MNRIITEITDTDLYKFTTMQIAWAKHPTATGTLTFKCRNQNINWNEALVREITEQIFALNTLSMSNEEIQYLAQLKGPGGFLFSEGFLAYLRHFRFSSVSVTICTINKDLHIKVKGPWHAITLWEIPILAIVNEVYMGQEQRGDLSGFMVPKYLNDNLVASGQFLHDNAPDGFTWTEFGTRRRFSKNWQDYVVNYHLNISPDKGRTLVGTSNVSLARRYGLECVGTMPHEYLQAYQAWSPLRKFQKEALLDWITFYQGNLGIALSDIVGMKAFLRDFDYLLSKSYDGARHDSGDPFHWGHDLIAHYESLGIDPRTKKAIWSDGLDFGTAVALYDTFHNKIQCGFGIGTKVTNDCSPWAVRPLNIVMKLTEIDGQPVAKLSDAPGKTMCSDEQYLAMLRRAYGVQE